MMNDLAKAIGRGIEERTGWKAGTDEELTAGMREYLKQRQAACPFAVGDIVQCISKNSKVTKAVVVEVCEPFLEKLSSGAPAEPVNMYIGTMAGNSDVAFKVFTAHSSEYVKAGGS